MKTRLKYTRTRRPRAGWRVLRHEGGASMVEWVGLVAAVAALMFGLMVALRAQGTSIGTSIGQVIQCNIAAFGGGCGGAAPGTVGVAGVAPGALNGIGLPATGLPLALAGLNIAPLAALLAGVAGLAGAGGILLGSITLANASSPISDPSARNWLPSLIGAWYAGQYGQLPRELLATARTYPRLAADKFRGRIHEVLWRRYHNANPFRVLRDGWAWLNANPNLRAWDGGLTGLRGRILVQLKSTEASIATYRDTINKYARQAWHYTQRQVLLINREAADDLARNIANRASQAGVAAGPALRRVGSSGVTSAESAALGATARGVATGSRGFWQLSGRVALTGARRAGAVGAVIGAGFSTWENVGAWRAGEIDGQTAAARITVDVGGAAASAAAGALAGAAIGSVIPVAGTAVGAVIGFGVGLVVSIGVQSLWDKYVKEPASGWLARQFKRIWP